MSRELVIIGGGTAALGAARAAVQGGARPTVVTDGPIGGDCTFTGCVPSKTLLAESRRGASFPDATARIEAVVERIAATESAEVLRSEGIEVLEGRGELDGGGRVVVDGAPVRADRVVLATGARPDVPPIPGLADVPHRTNESFFDARPRPARLGIVGAGPIGCEMAMAMAGFGTAVTVVDVASRVLPNEEPEASAVILAELRSLGVEVRLGATIERVRAVPGGVRVEVGHDAIEVDELLVATGRRPNVEGLGLAAAGIEQDDAGHPVVDHKLRTSVRSIHAAGDLTGLLPFTHAAYEQGRLAANHALRTGARWRYETSATPWVTFTMPEVARLGSTEAEAAQLGGSVAYLPLERVDRALTDDLTAGFVKLIAAPKRLTRSLFGGRLVGATIVAPRAGEMIHAPAVVARTGAFVARLAQTTAPYPAWSIAVQQAAGQFFVETDGLEARPARA